MCFRNLDLLVSSINVDLCFVCFLLPLLIIKPLTLVKAPFIM